MGAGSYGLGFGVLVAGVLGVSIWAWMRSRSEIVRCPNCGQYKMHWVTPVGASGHPDYLLSVGVVILVSGLLTREMGCVGLGLMAGLSFIAAGLWQRSRMRASCSHCRMVVSNSEMRSLLAGNIPADYQSPHAAAVAPPSRGLVECPVCKEQIREGALKCRHCGTSLD